MKYISTILFALCLGWTWKVIHKESSVSFQTHAALQSKLAEIIANTIRELKPESDNFEIKTLWTENLANGQVKAHFTYKFDEVDNTGEIIGSEINGEAILQKEASIANQNEHWTLTEVRTNTGSLNFKDGITITPNMGKVQPGAGGATAVGTPASTTSGPGEQPAATGTQQVPTDTNANTNGNGNGNGNSTGAIPADATSNPPSGTSQTAPETSTTAPSATQSPSAVPNSTAPTH